MKKIFVSLGILFVVTIGFLSYNWAFDTVEINERMTGPYYLVYVQHTGDYSKTWPIIDKLHTDLESQGWNVWSGIAIFYDDPQDTPTARLRSDLWILVASKDLDRIGQLSGQYLTQELEQKKRLISHFWYINDLSFAMGVFKVYPLMNKYIEEHNYDNSVARIEIYDNTTIQYLAEIIKK
jgi:AraC family transcriptional regulator